MRTIEAVPDNLPSLTTAEQVSPGIRKLNRTAERLFKNRPDTYKAIVSGLADGTTIRKLCNEHEVSPNTVMAIKKREGETLDDIKNYMAELWGTVGTTGLEALIEAIQQGKLPATSLPASNGIATEKLLLLSGQATSVVEHRQGLKPKDAIQMMRDMKAAKSKDMAIDADTIDNDSQHQ